MTKKENPNEALHEKNGISQPEVTSLNSISKIKDKRKVQPNIDHLAANLLKNKFL